MNPIENLKDLIIYQSQNNENISVEVLYDNEDFWLTQKSMSKLFEVEVNTINYHLKEIFKSLIDKTRSFLSRLNFSDIQDLLLIIHLRIKGIP